MEIRGGSTIRRTARIRSDSCSRVRRSRKEAFRYFRSRSLAQRGMKCHILDSRLLTDYFQIAESSGTLLEFSKHFGVKAHQTQRSGPLPGSIPTLENIEDLLQKSQKIQDALTRIKEVVITQNVAFAEQQKGPNQQMVNGYGPEPNGYQPPDETKAGGFAGPDPKKRRGRAAPPGRCHSCNRAETPEWRRGPDGARTLCNACGLRKFIFRIDVLKVD